MDLMPYIAASYALGILIPAAFAISAFMRVGAARRKLAEIDPRAQPGGRRRSRAGASQ